MTARKKRLGRGLEALLSRPVAETVSITGTDNLRNISLELLQRGQYQPRVDMRQDTLEDLANSIKSQGVVQPIVARPLQREDDDVQRYEIVAGERRWRAAQMAGLSDIPTVVRAVPDNAAIAVSLIENIQRENLNPLEEARALDRLIKEFELTHQEAADAVGRSRVAVSNLLRLLDLSERVKPMLESRQIEMGHARALLAISSAARQLEAAREIVGKQLSVRAAEQLVRRLLSDQAAGKSKKTASAPSADIRRLEVEVSDKLGAKVRIDHSQRGSGKVVISYNSLDELDGILKHIK
ncbi:MAG: ParB/RepB/Spo0J family partition protein [Woeseia sp.]